MSCFVIRFVIRHSDFVIRLIHIPLVALLAFQLLDVFVRLIDALAALLLDNLAQGCIHVLGHAARVTAHEKLRALGIDPFPDLGRIVPPSCAGRRFCEPDHVTTRNRAA